MVYSIGMKNYIRQISRLAGISIRTLHYYDEIGLLCPARDASNGYRRYSDADLIRLQQILIYRELGLPLDQIKRILDSPAFNALQALKEHKAALEKRVAQTRTLIQTVEKTIAHLKGKIDMENKELFLGFTDEEQKKYEKEARELWGDDQVEPTLKRWNSYSREKQQQILAEGGQIYTELVANMDKAPSSPRSRRSSPADTRTCVTSMNRIRIACWDSHKCITSIPAFKRPSPSSTPTWQAS